jgi:ArsR family metal-binding transcriptional regulator
VHNCANNLEEEIGTGEHDIFEMLKRVEKGKSIQEKVLVNKFEINQVLPCFTTPGYIRFFAQADHEIGEAIPIIFLKFPPGRTTYIEDENTLQLRLFNRMITFYPSGKITVTNTRDREEAEEILEKIKLTINEAYNDYLKHGTPNNDEIVAAKKISWTDVYAHLPKTNCGKCGYQVCSAFAVSLLQGETKLSDCAPLKEAANIPNLEKLEQEFGRYMLYALGWKEA